jgi:pyridoxal biosynthesis lyase PdxS
LTAEDTHDNDLFSTIFPKERSGRTGLGLLAGGVGSARISEALHEMQEVMEEIKKLWDVVNPLMSKQAKLEQQYSELKKSSFKLSKVPLC